MNAATLLKDFLNTGNTPNGMEYRYADLCAAMAEVDSAILRTAQTGGDEAEDAEYAAKFLVKLWRLLNESFEKNGKSIRLQRSMVPLPTEYRMALRTAERILASPANTYTPERRANIRDMIGELPALLHELPLTRELKQYVLLLVREVEAALDEYEVTGDFKLDGAFTRLQTALNVIAATPKPAESQSKLMNFLAEKAIPCLAAVTFSAVGLAADSLTVLDYLGVDVPLIPATTLNMLDAQPDADTPATAEETEPEHPQDAQSEQ